jgi:tetratricopeptide (TPR) repeat protein/tRNA A-37 threonylcarbamoyl transferase component Bud32
LSPPGAASPGAATPLLPEAAGRYLLEEEIGRGGMGEVLRARDPQLGRELAVKMLRGGHDHSDLLRRFIEEAQVCSQLQHPGIVPVYDLGALPDGRPFFAMKLVKGRTLADLLRERGSPADDLPRYLGIFEQVCQAVAYAHSKGVIHRDLKPDNVMVGAFGEVQVMDWGLAKVLRPPQGAAAQDTAAFSVVRTVRSASGDESRDGQALGTPAYMAPEQARGEVERLDERCDVFGLGAILCEVLTGRPPFTGGTPEEVHARAMRGDLGGAFARLDGCGAEAELVALAKGCLVAETGARPRDGGAVAEAVTAYRQAVQERLRQAELGRARAQVQAAEERRRRRLTLALAAAMLVGIVGTTIGLVWAEQARAAEAEQRALAQARQEKAEAESLRADNNAREAIARYDLAVDALNVVVGKVQSQLENTSVTVRVRTEILQAAMKVLQKSIEHGDSTGLSQRGLASAHMVLGNLLLEAGRQEEAAKQYEVCHRILAELYRINPGSDKARFNFAVSLSKQGDLDADLRHDLAAAQSRYREALALMEDLLAHPPANPEMPPTEIRAWVAESYQRLGHLAERLGPASGNDAEGIFEKALKLHKEVAAAEPSPGAKKKLAHAHYVLGEAQWNRHRETEAEKHYEAALALCIAAVRGDPDSVRFKAELFNLCGNVGDKLLLRGETARALPFYAAAIGPAERLAAIDGRVVVHRILSQSYYRMAVACARLNDAPGADANFAKCLAIREKVYAVNKNDNGAIDLMIARARCGKHEQAAALADDLLRRRPKHVAVLIQAACCYALCSSAVGHGKAATQLTSEDKAQQERYTERAIAALRNARANGYKDAHNLEVEPDLDPIRADSRFHSLIAEMQ